MIRNRPIPSGAAWRLDSLLAFDCDLFYRVIVQPDSGSFCAPSYRFKVGPDEHAQMISLRKSESRNEEG